MHKNFSIHLLSMEKPVVKRIIEEALKSWEYALDSAEYFIETYKEEGEFGYLFVGLIEAMQVVNDTSSGSIYHTLMDSYQLKEKYERDFVRLWARAKELRILAQQEIDNLFFKRKKNLSSKP